MPKKIQNFARSALVKPITINVGRAGAASMNVVQVSIIHFSIFECKLKFDFLGSRVCQPRSQNCPPIGMHSEDTTTCAHFR